MEIIYDSPSGSARPLREAYPSAAEGRVVLQIAISKAVAPLMETSPRIPEFGTPNRGLLDRFRGLLDRRHQEAELTVAVICQEMGMSRPTLNRRLKTLTGLAIKEHLQLLRLAKAAERLMSSSDPISIIAYDCGFTDPNYFCRHLRRSSTNRLRNFGPSMQVEPKVQKIEPKVQTVPNRTQ